MAASGIQLELLQDDSLLQASFCDVTDTSQLLQLDAWMMTSFAADDSGVSLGQSVDNDDEWSTGVPPGSHRYDVITQHATGATHASAVGNPPYDVVEHADNPGVVSRSPDRSAATVAAGSAGDDVIVAETRRCGSAPFSDEQVACICVALQQRRDVDTLETFLSTLTPRHWQSGHRQPELATRSLIAPSCDRDDLLPVTERRPTQPSSSAVADAVLSSAAHVAYRRGRYAQLYAVLRSRAFSAAHHAPLQRLWYDAHYAEATAARQRPLGAVDKYRIRRRHPPPSTIWDGQDTVYSFKVGQPPPSTYASTFNQRPQQGAYVDL